MRKNLQRAAVALLALGLIAGKKSKPAPEPAPAPAPAPAAEAEETAAPEPEPEPEAAGPVVSNANFDAKVVHADGSTTSGHVVRVERSEDWYAEQGWTDKAAKLTVTVEGNGTEKDVAWTDIRFIDLTYAGKSGIDCSYDSSYSPLMWTCTMKATTKVGLGDGSSWASATNHKWKFFFEDGKTEEFWIKKLPARQQEEAAGQLGDQTDTINAEIQIKLQDDLVKGAASTAVKRVEVTPR